MTPDSHVTVREVIQRVMLDSKVRCGGRVKEPTCTYGLQTLPT
jgi:hypothetical protein